MVLEALIGQLEQRFQHEKRVSVCLWFDEREEYRRLLPALQAHLAAMHPMPFELLVYDEAARHGQLWLRHQVHLATTAAKASGQAKPKFVFYLPMPEERLDGPVTGDGNQLDLLAEYRYSGILFRLNGKKPTLFSALRQAGVNLPNDPTDQRKLYEGGPDSLLAKYAAKFADRPDSFWTNELTPELAQARLVGDLDQTIMDVALSPEAAWAGLVEKGLETEFQDLVRERYGYIASASSPSSWIQGLVGMAALTETFVGFGGPAGFPLLVRVAPSALQGHHLALVKRWLRDSEYRQCWDEWITRQEEDINLSGWAAGRTGRSLAFPHLVGQRWQEIYGQFSEASKKTSATKDFFADFGKQVAEQAEVARSPNGEQGYWRLLKDLGQFLEDCQRAESQVQAVDSAGAAVRLFVDHAARVDGAHLALRHAADNTGVAEAAVVADRAYAAYTKALNDAFFSFASTSGSTEASGIGGVQAHLANAVWGAQDRRAVVIVDAFRYDCALALKDELRGNSVEVHPLLGLLPSITPVGMTALLPGAEHGVSAKVQADGVHPFFQGKDTAIRGNRLDILRAFGADCRDLDDIDAAAEPPEDLGELLVVSGHDALDNLGHDNASGLIRHLRLEIQALASLIRKLHRWGYPKVHVITDHGFVLLEEGHLPQEVPCDKQWCVLLKDRYAMVPASADVPLARFPFPWDPTLIVAVPPGLAFFKAEKSFAHGGASLQELVIPHLVSSSQVATEKRVQVEVVLAESELQRPVVKLVVRARSQAQAKKGAKSLFPDKGRTLTLDVRRCAPEGQAQSLLAKKGQTVRLESGAEQQVTLFLHSAERFVKDEQLFLDIRDEDTTEQFPAGGLTLRVGRDM
jgi:hypothetical protein